MAGNLVSPPKGGSGGHAPESAEAHSGLTKKIYEARCLLDDLGRLADAGQVELEVDEDQAIGEQERALMNELAAVLAAAGGADASSLGLCRDGRFELREANEGWTLLLDLEPPVADGAYVTARAILEALRERGITMGVGLKAIREAEARHRQGEIVQDLPIVGGQEPTAGEPGYIELNCRSNYDGPIESFAGLDQAPAKSAQRICMAGDVIARCVPPKLGKDGYNALGEIIPAQPLPGVTLQGGENTRMEDGCIIAEVDGTIEIAGQVVGVRRQLIVNRDLTGAETKITFEGDVRVEGSIRDHASVIASGDITVCDTVGAAHVESTHGSVHLEQGVAGQDHAQIIAGLDIHARFAERAILRSGRDIVLEVGSIQARMTAVRSFAATQNRGQVLGGLVIAGESITAKQLGHTNGVSTTLMAGFSPENLERWSEIEVKCLGLNQRYNHLKDTSDQIKRMVGSITKLSTDQQAVYAQLIQSMLQLHREINAVEAEKKELLKVGEEGVPGEIRALSMLQPGCEIRLGNACQRIQKGHRACRAILADNSIVIRPI